jgi:hypothetical protein
MEILLSVTGSIVFFVLWTLFWKAERKARRKAREGVHNGPLKYGPRSEFDQDNSHRKTWRGPR